MQKLMKNRKLVVIWEFILHFSNTKNCSATVCASFDPAVVKIVDKKIALSNDNKILENPDTYK